MKRINAFRLSGIVAVVSAVITITCAGSALAESKFITIGTGGVTGVYYPTGGAICRLVNRGHKDHGIRCSVEATSGSIYNINTLRQGEIDLAVAQSDWQHNAFYGTMAFAPQGAFKDLRSVFSLHSEAFTVLVREDSDIQKLEDIKGKNVNVGNPGSGNRATMDVVMEELGWTKRDFAVVSELKGQEQAQALCDKKIDVMIYNSGHPNGAVQEAASTCDVRILDIGGPAIERMTEKYPYYTYTTIPGGMYNGNPHDTKTFGVKATLVSSAAVPEKVIYEVVKSVFDNFDNFRTLHPVFYYLEETKLVNDNNTAPLHKGALKYYKERGWK